MKFIKAEELKTGMRLARPIYNRKGVLLFERDSKLTRQTIESVKNFGLLGIYILEPAEPVPPMTQEDLEFERFQTMAIFSIREELEQVLKTGKISRLQSVANMIMKNYGQRNDKINFYQSLRSREDYVYKHSLNTAILCALMSHAMNRTNEVQQQIILAAIVHDIGKVAISKMINDSDEQTTEAKERLYQAQEESIALIENLFDDGGNVARICIQALKAQKALEYGEPLSGKLSASAKILLVANRYDEMTVMKLGENCSDSVVKALQEFRRYPKIYAPEAVNALTSSIHILPPGASVELSNGEKALVLEQNPDDVLRPFLLNFRDNQIIDLSRWKFHNINVVDVMKTLDNRYIIDEEALIRAGFLEKTTEEATVQPDTSEKRDMDAGD